MKRAGLLVILLVLATASASAGEKKIFPLPEPSWRGGLGVGEALNERTSTRRFSEEAVTMKEVSLLLWASSGKTEDGTTSATRTIPSAGGIYPVRVYLLAKEVESLERGVYLYDPMDHAVTLVKSGDLSKQLSQAAMGQAFMRTAPACIIITALLDRTGRVYGDRGVERYVHMDAGHAAQNIYLVAASLSLGTVEVGAFIDERVKGVLGLEKETPLLIMPVGHPYRR